MFSHLVESGSHAADLKRRGRFFAGALACYGLLLAAAGVGSVYAFDAHLGATSDFEVIALLRFQPAEARHEPARAEPQRPAAAANRAQQIATRPEISHYTPYRGDRIAHEATKEIKVNRPVVIMPFTSDPPPGGISADPQARVGGPSSNAVGDGPRVLEAGSPPPPVPPRAAISPVTPPRPEGPIRVASHVISSKIIYRPVPPYPLAARAAGIEGMVAVHIVVDERGDVISARATSGNPLLLHAAVQAARRARFTPTLLNGQPVKVTGVITYNFTLQ